MASRPKKIVFVCTANTCRSPMAAALFRHALDAQPDSLKELEVTSAGVSAFPGQGPSSNSVQALKKVGIELSDHCSQPLSQELVDDALAFFCMTESHLAMLNYQIEPPPPNAFLMRQFMGDEADLEIPDPFGGSLAQYEACRDSMVEAIPSLIEVVGKMVDSAKEREAE
ncbi:low molecular weight protein arginine phosphatase [Pelagicoccus sp. SDUM812003]|uniref:low molecular weight protein arginine phosphatase n=1 Tax=Pelagicoccus sp. SDUM812003 TaxID=3041267 RepID=UPI00280E0135|nr:low molecular weight protein arginine phosphatase [Pelagicoccus sp. SDUM812003]MDQ8203314.1 low molecular weight protein arginine phosphatase [Pelagicoccus sp. SDUM812003]